MLREHYANDYDGGGSHEDGVRKEWVLGHQAHTLFTRRVTFFTDEDEQQEEEGGDSAEDHDYCSVDTFRLVVGEQVRPHDNVDLPGKQLLQW